MNILFEVPRTAENITLQKRVEEIATALHAMVDDSGNPERQAAARVVWNHGLAAHVGGHHVAIHERQCQCTDAMKSQRIALITHDAPDWK